MPIVRVRLLEDFPFPERDPLEVLRPAHEGDAGIDLHAAEDAVLLPGERKLVPTGIAIALPDGMEGQVRPRSGNALRHGLGLLNSPGTIDPGYRGPVKVICHNASAPFGPEQLKRIGETLEKTRREAAEASVRVVLDELSAGLAERTVRIRRGERIAQLVFARFERPVLEMVETLDETHRGTAGFGSTGMVGERA